MADESTQTIEIDISKVDISGIVLINHINTVNTTITSNGEQPRFVTRKIHSRRPARSEHELDGLLYSAKCARAPLTHSLSTTSAVEGIVLAIGKVGSSVSRLCIRTYHSQDYSVRSQTVEIFLTKLKSLKKEIVKV
ncbi:hypothetical protein WN51_07118 [Melipona quadrifasciata]|uniref:Uncharacterized protein n=1 Tax=Melipona quadrifasciata TaxID=166423 RepID=A0A0M8ZP00_9HYME|nr:hypothetical protein WN51_07118 [Melipona quadrifasciata]